MWVTGEGCLAVTGSMVHIKRGDLEGWFILATERFFQVAQCSILCTKSMVIDWGLEGGGSRGGCRRGRH